MSRSRWVGFDHESKENRVSILDREETKKENRNPREKGRRDSPAAVTTVGHGRAEDNQRRRAHWRTTTVVRTGAPELPPSCLDVRAGFGSRAPSPARSTAARSPSGERARRRGSRGSTATSSTGSHGPPPPPGESKGRKGKEEERHGSMSPCHGAVVDRAAPAREARRRRRRRSGPRKTGRKIS